MTKAEKNIIINRQRTLWTQLREYEYYLALEFTEGGELEKTYSEFRDWLDKHEHYQRRVYEWVAVFDIQNELGLEWKYTRDELTEREDFAVARKHELFTDK